MPSYKCPECDEDFATKYSLHRHTASKHKEESEEESEEESKEELEEESEDNEREVDIVTDFISNAMEGMETDINSSDDLLEHYDELFEKFKDYVSKPNQ